MGVEIRDNSPLRDKMSMTNCVFNPYSKYILNLRTQNTTTKISKVKFDCIFDNGLRQKQKNWDF